MDLFLLQDVARSQRGSSPKVGRDDIPQHHRLGGQHRLPAHHGVRLHGALPHCSHQGTNLVKITSPCRKLIEAHKILGLCKKCLL